VSEIHEPFDDDGVTYCGWDGHHGCGEVWPCSTVRGQKRHQYPPDYAGLQADLDELERTDPTVADAAQRYDDAAQRIRSLAAAKAKVAALPADQRAALEGEFRRAEREAQQIMRVGERCKHGRMLIDPCVFCDKERAT
jgi:hypothetical protein